MILIIYKTNEKLKNDIKSSEIPEYNMVLHHLFEKYLVTLENKPLLTITDINKLVVIYFY